MNVFADTCDAFYQAGLPVIPLHRKEKRPIPNGWQRFCEEMPDPRQIEAWKRDYPQGNIGLPLGPASNICVIDIDTEDKGLVNDLVALLPETPWVRYGKKGCVLGYRFNGVKTFQVRDLSGKPIVEFLSTSRQVVLPPSIHPDTDQPYTAINPLYDVHHSLPELDTEVEAILRGFLKDKGIKLNQSGHSRMTEWVPRGARDVKMTEQAGLLAAAVTRGERSLLEAIGMMRAWKNHFVEQVAGDDVDGEKGVQNLIKFLKRDVLERNKILPTGWDDGLTEEDIAELGLNFSEESRSWTAGAIRDWLRDKFETIDHNNVDARTPIVDQALRRLANSPDMTPLEIENVLGYIRDTSRLGLTMHALRRRVREIVQGDDIEGVNHTEIARDLKARLEEISPVRFDKETFWRWAGAHWRELRKTEIFQEISDHYGHLPAAKKSSDHKGIMEILANQCAVPLCQLPVDGVNFANGVVLEDGTIAPHNKDYGFTYTMPFRYLPEEAHKADRFFKFLEDSWGEDEDFDDKMQALQEAMAATIFGVASKFQRAILCLGPPRTGKTQILKIMGGLVPPEGQTSVPPEKWGTEYMTASLFGKIVNLCGELANDKFIDGQAFKQVVEGANMTVNKKYGQPFSFTPTCANWFASNHVPRTKDYSGGFNRRWLVLEFTKPVEIKDMIRDLAEQIIVEEREAIAAWAVEGLKRLKEQADYTLPVSHERVMGEVARANNSVRFFIEESEKIGFEDMKNASNPISEDDLYNAYSFFCSAGTGVPPAPLFKFRRMIQELEREFKFRRKLMETASGGSEIKYFGLTHADRVAA